MSTPKVSVIMPVYNAGSSLSRMIDSILAQTLTDWELIAIDDGSTDQSGPLLDRYAAKDARIKVFHKPNGGVAMARQAGVDRATGEYSIHADSDDWVESTMLEEMYGKAVAEDADMVIADDYVEHADGRVITRKQAPASDNSIDILCQIMTGGLFGGLCHKMIRHSLYGTHNARFFDGLNYCEDVLICAQILKHPGVKVAYLPSAYYHYLLNDASITHSITRRTYEMRLRYNEKLQEILPEQRFARCRSHSSLCVFQEAFVYDLLTREEIRRIFPQVEREAFSTKSLRWKTGYLMIKLGCYSWARKLLNYN